MLIRTECQISEQTITKYQPKWNNVKTSGLDPTSSGEKKDDSYPFGGGGKLHFGSAWIKAMRNGVRLD